MQRNETKVRKDWSQTPRAVVCPHCKAAIGAACTRPSGHAVFGKGYHAERIAIAERYLQTPFLLFPAAELPTPADQLQPRLF